MYGSIFLDEATKFKCEELRSMKFFKIRFLSMMVIGVMAFVMSGCGSSGGGGTNPTPTPTPTPPIEIVTLTAVHVTPSDTYVVVGESEQYTATAIYSDGTAKDVTSKAEWVTSDKEIAAINVDGTASGISEGNVTIAAIYSEDNIEKTGTAYLSVEAAPPTLKSLTIKGNNIVAIGLSEQLNAIATLSDDREFIVNDKVNWTSSDTAIAIVNAQGVVTGVSVGDVTITATAKNNSAIVATHSMSVSEATLTKIQIEKSYNPDTPQPITTLDVPITTEVYITAWGIYSDGSRHYINTDTFWWSSNQQIASINYLKSSYVYGRDVGTVTITAAYQGLKAELEVTVLPEDPALESIELISRTHGDVTNGSFTLAQGAKEWITAYGNYKGGERRDINRYVAYSSSDPKVAYVIDQIDSNVHGRSPGKAIISADWQGVHAEVEVKVTESKIEIQEGCSDSETPVIDDTNPLILTVGEEKCINAWLVHEDGTKERVTTTVFWRSQDQSIAYMDPFQRNSRVKGESIGETTVSAIQDGVTGIAPVHVIAAP